MATTWNPWHGCHKVSAGCLNCYMYRRDAKFGRDSSVVFKTKQFDLPIRRGRNHGFKLLPEDGIVFTCLSSDFFVAEADPWRNEAWAMIRERSDLDFFIITKRTDRILSHLPSDWTSRDDLSRDCISRDELRRDNQRSSGNWNCGYDNVHICCTAENQMEVYHRLPLFLELPLSHKSIIHEPLLGPIDLRNILDKYGDQLEMVTAGGESGPGARLCDYAWVMDIMLQCAEYDVPFHFHQTGENFRKGGRIYHIAREDQESQARLAGIDYPDKTLLEGLG